MRYLGRAVVLGVAVLALGACGSGSDDSAPTTTETVTETQTTTETDTITTETGTTTTETTPTIPPPERITITVRDGSPVGGIARPSVERGDRVVLVVRADVADHVHVHGYDVFGDVAPESPARLSFRATIPGRFEIELEDRGLPIAELTVRP